MKKTFAVTLVAGLLGASGVAFGCTGTIDQLSMARSGRVSIISQAIYGNGNGHDVCNLTIDRLGVDPSTCKGWLATLLAAYTAGGKVTIQMDGNATCSTVASWDQAAAPWAIFSQK